MKQAIFVLTLISSSFSQAAHLKDVMPVKPSMCVLALQTSEAEGLGETMAASCTAQAMTDSGQTHSVGYIFDAEASYATSDGERLMVFEMTQPIAVANNGGTSELLSFPVHVLLRTINTTEGPILIAESISNEIRNSDHKNSRIANVTSRNQRYWVPGNGSTTQLNTKGLLNIQNIIEFTSGEVLTVMIRCQISQW